MLIRLMTNSEWHNRLLDQAEDKADSREKKEVLAKAAAVLAGHHDADNFRPVAETRP